MIAWLRSAPSRFWAMLGAAALGALALGAAFLRGRSSGRATERARTSEAHREALGAELKADDELDARDRERERLEAEERGRLVQRTREQLARPPGTLSDAKREARDRVERARRASEDR